MKRDKWQGRKRGKNTLGGKGGHKIPRFWGKHAVYAALDNPERTVRKLYGTHVAISEIIVPEGVDVEYAEASDLARMVPGDVPHQGLVIEIEPLPDQYLGDILEQADGRPLVLLDQVTDPQNIGAILRSAAAFDAAAIITQDRHAPLENGTIAKAASGALETLPWVRVVNLSRALEEIAAAGYWRIGLTGHADILLADALPENTPVALVMGAEGEGMRQNVEGHCDQLARLPISGNMESLNVSNATAIALYAIATR